MKKITKLYYDMEVRVKAHPMKIFGGFINSSDYRNSNLRRK